MMSRSSLLSVLVLLVGCTFVTGEDLDLREDRDGDGVRFLQDCDDSDPGVGSAHTWYLDQDEDGWSGDKTKVSCSNPGGMLNVPERVDCDDNQPRVHPGAFEYCDEVDNDCDGVTDELRMDWFEDRDGDGFGHELVLQDTCPGGEVERLRLVDNGRDCNDKLAHVFPEAPFACDGSMVCDDRDFDCDGLVDCDSDGDGHSNFRCGGSDSNDGDDDRWEASFDWDGDGWDENMDGEVDVHLMAAASGTVVGTMPGWSLGSSLSSSGDLDGDGVEDLVIGAYGADIDDGAGGTLEDAGAVYVIYGPIEPQLELGDSIEAPNVLLSGWQGADDTSCGEGAQLGSQVMVHNFNSGDRDDLVVLARRGGWDGEPGPRRACVGVVYWLKGPVMEADSLESADATWLGVSEDQGLTFVFAGDLNGDRGDDLLLGSTDTRDDGGYGTIHIFPEPEDDGIARRVDVAPVQITGDNVGDKIGSPDRACALLFDGDGYQDLLIGAPSTTSIGGRTPGAVWFMQGPLYNDESDLREYTPSGEGVAIMGELSDKQVGDRLCPAGDMNLDGYEDLLVTGTRTDGRKGGFGSVYLVFGRDMKSQASMDNGDVAIEIMGHEAGVCLGSMAVSAGDIDDAGTPDLLLGGEEWFYVFVGPLGPDSGANLTTDDADARIRVDDDFVGADQLPNPAVGGNIGGSSIDDLAIPDPFWDAGESDSDEGRVLLFFGSEI
jgi:hypothetical protein